MDLEHLERRLREQVEESLGRRLSDDEWELLKRIQLQAAQADSPLDRDTWRWTRREQAAFVAAPVAALIGVGMLLQWDFVFSPFIRIPSGSFILLIALAVIWLWFASFFSPPFGLWEQLGWLWWGLVWGLLLLLPFAAAGGVVLFQDREYLTSTQEWAGQKVMPIVAVGAVLILAGLLLAWNGRPRRSGPR